MEAAKTKIPRLRSRGRRISFGPSSHAYGSGDRLRARLARRVRLSLRIPERITVTDWCEKHITLPNDSTRKVGKFRAIPYQVDILNDMGDPTISELVMMKSIRVGWTQMMGLGKAYCNGHLGSPSVLVTINGDKAKEFVKSFWEPLLRWKNNPNKLLKSIRRRYVKGAKQDQWSDWSFLNGGALPGKIPTATTSSGGSNSESNSVLHKGHGMNLVGAVKASLLGTPRVSTNGGLGFAMSPDKSRLEDQAAATVSPGALHPEFLCWLMGYPEKWLDAMPRVKPPGGTRAARRAKGSETP